PIEKKELKGFNHGYILQLENPNYLFKYLQMSSAMSHYHSGIMKGAEYCRSKFPTVKKQWDSIKPKGKDRGMSI
ncbi:hypothetical protein, partial [Fulvivirga sp.]